MDVMISHTQYGKLNRLQKTDFRTRTNAYHEGVNGSRPELEQEFDNLSVAVGHGLVQRAPAQVVPRVDVHVWGGQKVGHSGHVAIAARDKEGCFT